MARTLRHRDIYFAGLMSAFKKLMDTEDLRDAR